MLNMKNDSIIGNLPTEAQWSLERFVNALERREKMLSQSETPWSHMCAIEQQIWDHAGEILAQPKIYHQCLHEMAESPDTALVRAGVWLLALLDQGVEEIGALLEQQDANEADFDDFFQALGRGLESVSGEKTLPLITMTARSQHPERRRFAAWYLGYRRLNIPMLLLSLIEDDDEDVACEAALTAGKLGVVELRPRLENKLRLHYRVGDFTRRDQVALALHLLGSPLPGLHARACLQEQEPISEKLALLLAIDGRAEDEVFFHQLNTLAPTPTVNSHALVAWGFPSAVPILIEALEQHPDHGAAIATALYQITGAPLFVAPGAEEDLADISLQDTEDFDDVDETCLASHDMESMDEDDDALEDGDSMQDRPLSRDAMRWHHWWLDHQTNFDQATRYRFGSPLHAQVLLNQLGREESHHGDRRRVLLELARCKGFGPGMSFEPEWWTQHQFHYLAVLKGRL